MDFLYVSQRNRSKRLLILGHKVEWFRCGQMWKGHSKKRKDVGVCTFSPCRTYNNWLYCHPKWKTSASNSSSKGYTQNTPVISTMLLVTLSIVYNQLCTHHVSLFDTVAAPQHARPVALPVSPFWFFSIILKGVVTTVIVVGPARKNRRLQICHCATRTQVKQHAALLY